MRHGGALVHVWTAPGMQEESEWFDGRIDCDHVSGLFMRLMTAGPDGFRDPVPYVDGPLLARCFRSALTKSLASICPAC
jgi:hypothetical protein